jgi:hypothetical protein
MSVPQHDEAYWRARSAEYVARLMEKGLYDKRVEELRPIWEQLLKDRLTGLEAKVPEAQAAVKAAKDPDMVKFAEKSLADLQKDRRRSSSSRPRSSRRTRKVPSSSGSCGAGKRRTRTSLTPIGCWPTIITPAWAATGSPTCRRSRPRHRPWS